MTKPYSAISAVEIGPDSLKVGAQSFPFLVKRDSRARRMLLRVMPRDGAVILVLPTRASLKSGQQFVTEQVDWILARVRSGVNVMSDMLVAILLDELESRQPSDDSASVPVKSSML